MTTVVCTPREMASDSMASDDVQSSVIKIWRVNNGVLGVAGPYTYGYGLYRWLKGEAVKPVVKDLHALFIDGVDIWMYDEHHEPYTLDEQYAAIGSGAMAALAAMEMGASVERAVEVACKLDPWSGGRVRRLEV